MPIKRNPVKKTPDLAGYPRLRLSETFLSQTHFQIDRRVRHPQAEPQDQQEITALVDEARPHTAHQT